MRNTTRKMGLNFRPITTADFIFRVNSPLRGVEIAKEYSKDLPEPENQSFRNEQFYIDTLACVSFSALNCVETEFNALIRMGLLSPDDYAWLKEKGYIINGMFNCSDRFTAKMSGTTKNGNDAWAVGNSIHNDGVVPEAVWPTPPAPFDWDTYYADPSEEAINLGQDFKKRFNIGYEAVYAPRWAEAQQQGPLQVFVHAWGQKLADTYIRTTAGINHAVMLYDNEEHLIYDHYDPYKKRLANDFIYYDFAFLYTIKKAIEPMKLKENYLYQLVSGSGGFGLAVGGKLLVDDTAKILASFLVRNGGDTKGKTIAVGQTDWDSAPHYNLKMEKLN